MAAFRARKRKILNTDEIDKLLGELVREFGGRWGYAGSYARGTQKLKSDLDIVYDGVDIVYEHNLKEICSVVEKNITIAYDLIDLESCKEEDEELDKLGLDIGVGINDTSCYKNIVRDVKWYSI